MHAFSSASKWRTSWTRSAIGAGSVHKPEHNLLLESFLTNSCCVLLDSFPRNCIIMPFSAGTAVRFRLPPPHIRNENRLPFGALRRPETAIIILDRFRPQIPTSSKSSSKLLLKLECGNSGRIVTEFWKIGLAPLQNLVTLSFSTMPSGTEALTLENGDKAGGSIPAIGSISNCGCSNGLA